MPDTIFQPDPAPLYLNKQDSGVGVEDDDVRLSLVFTELVGKAPLYAMENAPGIVQRLKGAQYVPFGMVTGFLKAGRFVEINWWVEDGHNDVGKVKRNRAQPLTPRCRAMASLKS